MFDLWDHFLQTPQGRTATHSKLAPECLSVVPFLMTDDAAELLHSLGHGRP